MILRLILLLLAIWFVVALVRYIRRLGKRPGQAANPGNPRHMVQCLYCGTHLPAENAIQTAAGYYCCEEHRHKDGQS